MCSQFIAGNTKHLPGYIGNTMPERQNANGTAKVGSTAPAEWVIMLRAPTNRMCADSRGPLSVG
jgi:hypothetical protein